MKGRNNFCKAAVVCTVFGVLTIFAGCGKTEAVKPEGRCFCLDTGVKSPICLKLSELFSGFRNQVVLSVD